MALDTALTALAQGFQIGLDASGAANRSFAAKLIPPIGALDDKGLLQVVDLVTATEVVNAPIDLSLITKNVRFLNTDITNPQILGGLPINDLLAINVGNVTTGATNPPGVPGLVGMLTGTLPLPIDVTHPETFQVRADVRWRIAEGSHTVSDVSWTVGGTSPLSGTGGDIQPPSGRGLDPVDLLFDLAFTELVGGAAPIVHRTLHASLQLAAGPVSSGWIDLPPVPLDLPAIPVPTLVVYCQNKDFQSNKLVVVPANSPLDESTIEGALTELRDVLTPLRATSSFLGIFLDEFDTVANLIRSGNLHFRKTNEIANLNDIDLESGWINDTEAEDELSSLVFVGPPGRRIENFNDRDFSTSEGQMDVTLRHELIALLRDTHSTSPASEPPGCVTVPFAPHGSHWDGVDPWSDITSFGDQLSSMRFSWEP
jgi:hypothetical protein